jgi:hypothetical protein
VTFGSLITALFTLLLALFFVYIALRRESKFYWSGYLHGIPKERRGPAVPTWIGRTAFLAIAVWLIYRFYLELHTK